MKEKKRIEIDTFNNFNSSNNIYTEKFYNFFPSNKLASSQGVAVAKFPKMYTDMTEEELDIEDLDINSVCGVSYFKMYFPDSQNTQHRILIYGDDNKVYINQLFSGSSMLLWLFNLQFNSPPVSLSYKTDDTDSIILTSSDKMVVWHTNYSPYEIENVPIITSMCMNDEVLFCTIKDPAFKIWYATNLDAENVGQVSAESGYISLEDDLGYSRKILTFNEEIYVFRDYGITQLSIYGSDDFAINHIYLSDSYIYPDSIAQSGDNVYFLERSGLKCFNGSSVKNIELGCEKLLSAFNQSKCWATCFEGKYYLACKCDFADGQQIGCESYNNGYVNNALLVYDIEKEHLDILRGVDINQVLALNNPYKSKLVACFNNQYIGKIGQLTEDGKLFGNSLGGYWKSVKTDLGYHNKKKRIKHFSIKASGNAEVTISSEKESKTFNILPKDKIQRIRVNISGNEFDVKITTSGQASISNFVLTASVKK